MLRSLAPIVVLLLAGPVPADDKDWTGKTVKLKSDNLKMGSKLAGGLVRDGAALDTAKTYVVKSDDGSYLELVGQTGYVFKLEAEVVAAPAPKADAPAPKLVPKTDAKTLWPAETHVLPKKRPESIRFGDRDATGNEVFFPLSGIVPMLVRKDLGDGWVRIHDGHREGWVRKDDLVTKADAPTYWDGAVKANPKDTWALLMRGTGWWQKGDPDAAIKDFDECIRLEPKDVDAYNGRALAWSAKGEYDKAIADYTLALHLEPRFALAFHNRAIAWYLKKEYDKAIEDCTQSIRLNSLYPLAHENRGDAWRAKKEYDKAIADYTEAIRLDPKLVGARVARGLARYGQKNYQRAVADFDDALQLDPKNAPALGDKALALAKLKKYPDAAAGFEAALKLDPRDGLQRDYALFLATCPEAKYRDGKRAVELAKKAIEKAGNGADWRYAAALAAAAAESADFDRAIAEQQKALDDKALAADDRKTMAARLELYRAKKPLRDD